MRYKRTEVDSLDKSYWYSWYSDKQKFNINKQVEDTMVLKALSQVLSELKTIKEHLGISDKSNKPLDMWNEKGGEEE